MALPSKWNDGRWWKKTTRCTHKQLEKQQDWHIGHDAVTNKNLMRSIEHWQHIMDHMRAYRLNSNAGFIQIILFQLVHYTIMWDHTRLDWDCQPCWQWLIYHLIISKKEGMPTTRELIVCKKRFEKMNGPMAIQGNNEWVAEWQWLAEWNYDNGLNANGIIWQLNCPTCPTNALAKNLRADFEDLLSNDNLLNNKGLVNTGRMTGQSMSGKYHIYQHMSKGSALT